MIMDKYAAILSIKYDDHLWTINAPMDNSEEGIDSYDLLDWSDENTIPKPTREELDALWPEVEIAIKWDAIVNQRNILLKDSDWTQLSDIPKDVKNKWKKYRQELRDLPQFFDDPDFVIWPEKPE